MKKLRPHSEDGVRRAVLGVLGMLALLLGSASVSSAQDFTPQFFQITVTRAQLSTDGVTFTELPGVGKTFAITGGDPGAVLGDLLSNVEVAAGNYTKFRVFISCNVSVRAQFNGNCTLANGTFGACPVGGAETATFTIPAAQGCGAEIANEISKTFDISLNITGAETRTRVLSVSFDNQASQQGGGVGAPPSTLQVQE